MTGARLSIEDLDALGDDAQAQIKSQLPDRRPRKLKYRNKPVTIDDHWFPSRKEAKRYGQLKILSMAGKITDLRLQQRFILSVNDIKVTTYVADFTYYRDGQFIVEDAKGIRTAAYVLKRRLFRAIHGFDIVEV